MQFTSAKNHLILPMHSNVTSNIVVGFTLRGPPCTKILAFIEFNMSFHAGQPFVDARGELKFCSLRCLHCTLTDSILTVIGSLRSRLIHNSFHCQTNTSASYYLYFCVGFCLTGLVFQNYCRPSHDRPVGYMLHI